MAEVEQGLSAFFSALLAFFSTSMRMVTRFVVQVVSRIWLVIGLTVLLLRAIGVGRKWLAKLLRLAVFAAILGPAWIKTGIFYFSNRVLKDVRYGPKPRNYCDIYTVSGEKKDLPVLVLVMGGAWIIGYKAWSALMAKYISENGVIVIAVDYRNFPQGDIEDMKQDIHQSLIWTHKNIAKYGGDPSNISLLGQSAGAHISTLCMLDNIKSLRNEKNDAEAHTEAGLPSVPIYTVKNFISLSGPYDLPAQSYKFAEHGFHSVIFSLVMKGDLIAYSPIHWVKKHLGGKRNEGKTKTKTHEYVMQKDDDGRVTILDFEAYSPLLWMKGSDREKEKAREELAQKIEKRRSRKEMRNRQRESKYHVEGPEPDNSDINVCAKVDPHNRNAASCEDKTGDIDECHQRDVANNASSDSDSSDYIPIGLSILEPKEQEEVVRELSVEKRWREKYLPKDEGEEDRPPTPFSRKRRESAGTAEIPPSLRNKTPLTPREQSRMPSFTIIHGTEDNCVCWTYAHRFAKALDQADIPNKLLLDVDKTHTDYILEGLMSTSEKSILFPILESIKGKQKATNEFEDDNLFWLHDPVRIPRCLVLAARFVNPF